MPPLSLLIKPVSGGCNMRCRYCFYHDVMAHRQQHILPPMTEDTLEKLVKKAFLYAEGSVSFAFQGGEPTLIGLPFFEKLLQLQKKYNTRRIQVHNAVQTNGLNLSDDMIALFARERFLVGVSLDGDEDTHDLFRVDAQGNGTFARIENTLQRLEKAGVEFNILCVVTENAARKGKEIFNSLKRYKYLQFIPCLDELDGQKAPHSLTEEGYLTFLKDVFACYQAHIDGGSPVSIRQFDNFLSMLLGAPPESCAMSGRCGQYYLVESDGSVYPCDFYVLDEWRMGNVCTDSFFKLEKSEKGAAFRASSLPVPDTCKSCKWYFLCRNGCRREREGGVNKWCKVIYAFLDEYGETLLRLARKLGGNT